MSVKPYSDYGGLFATNGDKDPQIYLKIRIWTALRSLGPSFSRFAMKCSPASILLFLDHSSEEK